VTDVFAHRGLHRTAGENSVAAFLEAREAGCDGVELDVRRCADGALVVHHDAEVPGVGPIGTIPCHNLPAGVASLVEAMTACEGMRVNVEVKNDPSSEWYDRSGGLAHQVVTALEEMGRLADVIVSSFDLATCEAVRQAGRPVEVGWLLGIGQDPDAAIETVLRAGLDAIHPIFARVDAALVRRAHSAGVAVNVWTVNVVEDMRRMLDFDVDVLITDEPVLALTTAGRHVSP
jgi:glycerophosphoryl diester phosphodiesterase